MRGTIAACAILVLLVGTANAEQCPPGALGVSRTLVVDPNEHPRVGSMQYPETLPLNDHEVVLTFDDGPLPRYTNGVLETLASECVKATFFMVGQMARAYPSMVRRVFDEGHTVANHTQNHPIRKMSATQAAREIERVLRRCATPSATRRRCRLSFGYPVCCARSRSSSTSRPMAI
jgi:peptidoglycan-N-acetylglucosamine deacetylase